MNNEPLTLVFCTDNTAKSGLFITLASCLANIDPRREVTIHLLTDFLTDTDLKDLNAQLDLIHSSYRINKINISTKEFSSFKWLGGYMTYARILIPNLIDEPKALYLDCDLVINTDVCELFDIPLQGHPFGAVSWNDVSTSNDSFFLLHHQCLAEQKYFNAGVLLLDLEALRDDRFTEKCIDFGAVHGKALPSADQTILNFLYGKAFLPLPRRYNTVISTDRETLVAEQIHDRIIHFVGYPKPWSLFGGIHPNSWILKTVCVWNPAMLRTRTIFPSPRELWRVFRKGRAYLKCAVARMKFQ